MPIVLTETAIKKAIRETAGAGRIDLADAGCPGLRLRLTPAGSKTWVLACRDRYGRMRRFQLGHFPDLGVSQARTAARALHAKVKHEGADPIAERRHDRAALGLGVATLAGLLDCYHEMVGNRQKRYKEARSRIEKVYQALLTQPLSALSAREIQLRADAYPALMSASAAVRYLRPILKWGAQRGYVDHECYRINPPAPVKRRARFLSPDELAALLPVLRASPKPHAAALLFMLLTLARREEVAQARWRHVDPASSLWTILDPKNGQPHLVPLSDQAMALLRARMPLNPEPDGFVFCTSTGGALGNWDRETKKFQAASGTRDWTRHDLRRTGATLLGEMGELPDIIEAALNHISIRSTLAATYNRSRYRPQVASALQRLAGLLDDIAAGAAGGSSCTMAKTTS